MSERIFWLLFIYFLVSFALWTPPITVPIFWVQSSESNLLGSIYKFIWRCAQQSSPLSVSNGILIVQCKQVDARVNLSAVCLLLIWTCTAKLRADVFAIYSIPNVFNLNLPHLTRRNSIAIVRNQKTKLASRLVNDDRFGSGRRRSATSTFKHIYCRFSIGAYLF